MGKKHEKKRKKEHREHQFEEGHGHGQCGCCGGEEEHADGPKTALDIWQETFTCAVQEVQVEILKKKIYKAWGKSMEGIADSVVDLMRDDWRQMQGDKNAGKDRGKRVQELVEKIRKAYAEGPKK